MASTPVKLEDVTFTPGWRLVVDAFLAFVTHLHVANGFENLPYEMHAEVLERGELSIHFPLVLQLLQIPVEGWRMKKLSS